LSLISRANRLGLARNLSIEEMAQQSSRLGRSVLGPDGVTRFPALLLVV